MNSKGLLGEVVAETFGTFILVLLGVGVVANVGLAPRMGSPASFNWLTITIGWCFAVVVAVYTVGRGLAKCVYHRPWLDLRPNLLGR
jgi:glycerol uptake facilitator protein